MPLRWFDAHLDLAYLAVNGRDMTAPAHDLDSLGKPGPHPPAAVTLPELEDARVRFALATIYTERDGEGPEGYPADDAERAWRAGRTQLEVYLTWRDQKRIALDLGSVLREDPSVGEVRAGMGVAETIPIPLEQRVARISQRPFLRVGILMENADPIRTPEELPWWAERGVVAVGLAWAKPSRYADGNAVARGSEERGLTDLGRELVREIDRAGVLHDCSHLSDRAFDDLCAATTRTIIASHSNCRAITDPSGANQRHATDAQIKEIARRGGVVGLNLFSPFLSRAAAARPDNGTPAPRATLADVYAHADHICQLTGSHEHVGLGSDMDGGFSAQRLPDDISGPDDLRRLADEFSARGMSDEAVHAFAWRNFARLFAAPRQAGPVPRVSDARRPAGA